MRRSSTFSSLIKTDSNFSIAFEKKYSKKFVAIRLMDTVETSWALSSLLGEVLSFISNTLGPPRQTKRQRCPTFVESLGADDAGSNLLGILRLSDV